MFDQLQIMADRYEELGELLSDPDVVSDTKRFMASLNNFKFLSYNSVIKTKKLTYTPFFKTSANSYVKNVGF